MRDSEQIIQEINDMIDAECKKQERRFMVAYLALFLLAILYFSQVGYAETRVTPFLSLGIYKLDCNLTDRMICDDDRFGSETPGTIDLGLNFSRCSLFFGADTCDLLWHHQSYVNRGDPFNDEPEAQMDMYGFRATWYFESVSFTF